MKTWQWLGYAGLIPFLACLWLSETSFGTDSNNLSFNPQQAFLYYSAIILSFLAGALWRKDTLTGNSITQLISNFFCLYAFFCLFLPVFYPLIFLPMGFLSLFFAEYILCNNKEYAYSKPYFTMRLRLTVLVSLLHGFALISWF